MKESSSIRGHVAIVTGGAAGIGEAVVDRFAEEGARIAVLDKDSAKGASVVEKLKSGGTDAIYIQADVGSSVDVKEAFRVTDARWGRLSILVNCAGGFFDTTPIESLEEDDWDASLAWNLKSAYLCCKAAVVLMKKGGYGRIVSVSSLTARTGVLETALHYS